MRPGLLFIAFMLLYGTVAYSQPLYSPEIRAERETTWMHDSLKLPETTLKKVHDISLTYYKKKDSVNDAGGKYADKHKVKLERGKDEAIRKLLTKAQYKQYCKREKMIRLTEKRKYKGRQPY